MIQLKWVILILSFIVETTFLVPIIQAGECHMLIVSFISTGAGIDRNVQQEFEFFLKTEYPNISYEKIIRGREGELDYCFKLSDLSVARKATFIESSKQILTRSSLVEISENSNCGKD